MASMSSLRQVVKPRVDQGAASASRMKKPPKSAAVEKVKAPSPHESFSNLFRNSKLASVTYPVPAPSTLQPQRAGAFTSNTTPPFASLSLSGYQMLPTGEQPILPHHVITTSPDLKLKGEWGLKRSLPRDLNASNVIVTRLDHHSLGSRGTYRTASREVGDLRRWRYLFGYNEEVPELQREAFSVQQSITSNKSTSNDLAPVPVILENLDTGSYLALLRRARTLSKEWIKGASTRAMSISKTNWDRFLHLDTNPAFKTPSSISVPGHEVNQPYRSVHPPFYLVSPLPRREPDERGGIDSSLVYNSFMPSGTDKLSGEFSSFTDAVFGSDTPNRPSTASVVKPETISTSIYNTNLPTDLRDIPTLAPLPVSGKPPLPLLKNRIMVRYLNSVMHGHAVSVLGLVGFVPEREAGDFLEMSFGGGSSSNVMDRAPLVAHVLNASFEADGTPVISLSLKHSAVEEAVKKTGSFYSRSAGSPASIMAKASKAPRSPVGGKKRNVDAVSSASLMGSSPSAVGTELLSDALEGRTGLTGRFVETPLIPRNSGSKRRQASEPAWSPLTAMKSAEAAASAEGTVGAKLNLPETAKVMKLFDGPEATAKRDRKAPASRGATSPRPKSE